MRFELDEKQGRLARQRARRRRREQIAGVVVVCLGVVVLVVAIFALREPDGHVSADSTGTAANSAAASDRVSPDRTGSKHPTQSRSADRSDPATTSSASTPTTSSSGRTPGAESLKDVPLVVLNNTTIRHLARDASQRFESGGWTVSQYANYQNNILSTCAYYDPDDSRAKSAAEALQDQYPTIKRVKPQFSELGVYDSPIVVILTPDYSPY